MASYTQITLSEAQEILELYGITGIKELIPLNFGISNSNYQVILESQDKIILKISNDKNPYELAEEQKILQYLKQNGYSYSLSPYLTNDGRSVYSWDKYFGVIYPFVTGDIPEISIESIQSIGKAMAQMHQISIDNGGYQNLRNHTEVGFGLQQIHDFAHSSKCPKEFSSAFELVFPESIFQEIVKEELPSGIIHGDLYYDNTLFLNGELSAVLDFEQSGIGDFLFDIGISISGSCLTKGDIDLELVNHFTEGYELIRPLQEVEKKMLYYSIIAGLFSISLWRIKRFIEKNLDSTKTENYKELIHRALRLHQKINP